jgi:hypothetical protein
MTASEPKLREKGVAAQQAVLAHLRETTGHSTLPAYNSNGAQPEAKTELYRLLIQAVVKGDYSQLKGKTPKGQAVAPAVEETQAPAIQIARKGEDSGRRSKPASEPASEQEPVSWKLGVKTRGDSKWGYNAVRLASKADCEAYGSELASRWFAVESYEAHPCDEPVTYHMVEGKAVPLPKPEEPAPVSVADVARKVGLENLPNVIVMTVGDKPKPVTEVAPRAVVPEPEPVVEVTPRSVTPEPAPVDDKLAAVVAALRGLVQPAAPAQALAMDTAQIEAIVRRVVLEVCTEQIVKAQRELERMVDRQIHNAKFELLKAMEREAKTYRVELAERLMKD